MDFCCGQDPRKAKEADELFEVLKAVSEPNRLRMLCILAKEKICVCKLAKLMGISHNLISFHFKTLFEVGILEKKREGNQIFYSIHKDWEDRIQSLFTFLNLI